MSARRWAQLVPKLFTSEKYRHSRMKQMYPVELEIKDTTESNTSELISVDRKGRSTSYFDL